MSDFDPNKIDNPVVAALLNKQKSGWASELKDSLKSKWEITQLGPEQEKDFRKTITTTPWFSEIKQSIAQENGMTADQIEDGRALDMVLENSDYDYRGAYLAGAVQERDSHDGLMHWPSYAGGKMLKSPQHPTAWKEYYMREKGTNPDDSGVSLLQALYQSDLMSRATKGPR